MPDDGPAVREAQALHWDAVFAAHPDLYGAEPSAPAREAAELFAASGCTDLLELGAGHGRDSVHFAGLGMRVVAVDLSATALAAATAAADRSGLGAEVVTARLDVRSPLPFAGGSFDACYSHMLFCMALTTAELEALAAEVRRVLRDGGLCVYTVRTVEDVHAHTGTDHGDGMRENDGFVVHFFDRALVERLADGFDLVDISGFEEGTLPRRLWRVTMRRR